MACEVEVVADCGDISCLSRALFMKDKDGEITFLNSL